MKLWIKNQNFRKTKAGYEKMLSQLKNFSQG